MAEPGIPTPGQKQLECPGHLSPGPPNVGEDLTRGARAGGERQEERGREGMGCLLGLRRKVLKETRKPRNVSTGGDEGSQRPRARARPGRAGLEPEAEGLRLQEAAAAAGDTCRWGP